MEPEAYARIGRALAGTASDRAAFARGLRTEAGSYQIAHLPAGHCGFLEGGLCSLHRRFGEALLPDVCTSFPRAVTHRGPERLLTASLACPEAARRLLLAPDGAERVEVPEAALPRPRPPEARPPLETPLERAAERLHAQPASLRAQLVTLARSAASGEAVSEAMEEAQVQALVFPWAKVASLLLSLLHTRSGYAAQPRWTALVERLQARVDTEDALTVYLAARDAQDARHGERISRAFRHYARYQWARFPVAEAPSPVAYVCRLALRVAMIRFLLALTVPAEATVEALDAGIVECFQLSAKHLEQHPAVREQVDALLACEEPDRFMKALLLATFV